MTLLPPHFIEILDYVDMISIMQPLQIFQVQLHAKKISQRYPNGYKFSDWDGYIVTWCIITKEVAMKGCIQSAQVLKQAVAFKQ